MIILGIDPGSTTIGYAVLEHNHPLTFLKAANWINLSKTAPKDRLLALHQEIKKLIRLWQPDAVAVERLFFSKNTKTAFAVSESRGAILLTTLLAGLTVFEYTPLEVKKTVTGDGKADKDQVKKMVQLCIKEARDLNMRDDVFDAIAIALTYAWRDSRPLTYIQ